MLFQTTEFLIFFVLLCLLLLIFKNNSRRKLLLFVASYVFYMWWNPAFILLIIFSTFVDFILGRQIDLTDNKTKRKVFLTLSLIANLGVLGFFKYANFFQDNMFAFMRLLGSEPSWTSLNIILPVGISFYTFQTLSYTIDIYKGNLSPCRSPLDFALFVAFFPQLVAGPIVRAVDFLPQLNNHDSKLNFDRVAFFTILRGLIKKVIIADNIALFADAIFDSPFDYGSATIWLATIAFYIQIYCDFSGYSDMAIGIARILGYKLPDNFNRPYFATNPSDFWKRWHITLSGWLRDYLYIPLGGNRSGKWLTYRNLMITMLIGGLWHGANWSFVLWGGLHGIALIAYRLWQKNFAGKPNILGKSKISLSIQAFFSWALMQYWVLLTWIPFRVTDTQQMLYSVRKFVVFDFGLPKTHSGLGTILPYAICIILLFAILHTYSYFKGGLDKQLARLSPNLCFVICILIGLFAFLLWPTTEAPFIYFQF